jgi:hypothetical protein
MMDLVLGFLLTYCIICYTIASYTLYIVWSEGSFGKMDTTQIRTMIALFLAAPLTVPAIGWELRTKPEN